MSEPAAGPARLPGITLVLGGARSGKSRHAEQLIEQSGLKPVYLATAEGRDEEMVSRIRMHRERRGSSWRTLEVPLDLPAALREATAEQAILIDCLTLWLSNLMGSGRDVETSVGSLVRALDQIRGPVVFVSNEVGQGVVPASELGRRFVDEAGRLHQRLAAVADRVVLMVAGLPLVLKDVSCTS